MLKTNYYFMKTKTLTFLLLLAFAGSLFAQQPVPNKPRVLVSSDIGGTDPDDNQSMAHLLMFNDLFDLEGLVSSPSYGEGSKQEIMRMIGLYAKDYPKLKRHAPGLRTPDELLALCKQGRHGLAPYKGWDKPTEGSRWIVKCAMKPDPRPLWVLVWGGLEDVAQALHDAPQIKDKIRVYFIGGPNKKWCVNAYAYTVSHFPDLWIIEDNASYRGFISDNNAETFWNDYMKDAGTLGNDFVNYYKGNIKMGDTPSLLYMMDGDPSHPERESWGGSFEKMSHSSRLITRRNLTLQDTVPVYSVIEFHFTGPKNIVKPGSPCFTMTIEKQKWNGIYQGDGIYSIRYAPKESKTMHYEISSNIKALNGQHGDFVASRLWPGKRMKDDYPVGPNWYTDRADEQYFEGNLQGAKTVRKWRADVLRAWAERLSWLKE